MAPPCAARCDYYPPLFWRTAMFDFLIKTVVTAVVTEVAAKILETLED